MRTRIRGAASAAGVLLLCLLAPALAHAEDVLDKGDTAWILTSTALVLLMTLPGLALFYGGLVRTKNLLSILMQCLASAGLMGLLWVLVGYSLAFGEGNAWIGDLSMAGLAGITPESVSGSIPSSSMTAMMRSRPRETPTDGTSWLENMPISLS